LKAHIILKAFLSQCEPEKRVALEKFLPPAEKGELDQLPVPGEDIDSDWISSSKVLERVHWSWFLPTLKTYSEYEQKLFLSALSPYEAKNLAKSLTLSLNGQEISEIGRAFLRKILLDSLLGPHDRLLPVGYLPHSSLSKLLSFSKKELTHLIERLSLYDLVIELKQIVETKILKKIYALLSEEEKKFLKVAMTQKEHFAIGKMGLDRWDGSEESLRTLLHKRGLARLGVGLSTEHPDFIWYICHQLDIGRGSALYKLCTEQSVQNMTNAVIKQIEDFL
jgi:hypothetical protein